MENIKKLKKNYRELLILFLIFIISFLFRYHDLMRGSLFMDEMDTFFVSDPNISYKTTYERILNSEAYNFYYYLYKIFFSLFGYNDYNARLFTCIIGSLIPLACFKLYKEHFSNKNQIFFLILVVLNIYLINKSQEVRAQVFYCLFVILNIHFFLNILKNKNIFNISLYILTGLISMLIMNFSILVIFSQFVFLIFKKKYFINFFFYMTTIMILFIILNFEQLEIWLFGIFDKNFEISAIGALTISNFYDIFFRYYFGSRVTGVLTLVFLIYLILRVMFEKKTRVNDNILFLLILLFCTYFIPVTYSIIKSPVLLPRYIIYAVPVILILICTLSEIKSLTGVCFIFVFLIINANSIYQKFVLKKFNKPNYKEAFLENEIKNQTIYIYGNQTLILKNMLENSLLKNNLDFGDKNDLEIKLPKIFIGLCSKDVRIENYKYKIIKKYNSNYLLENYYRFCQFQRVKN